jgi:hypothetical protein
VPHPFIEYGLVVFTAEDDELELARVLAAFRADGHRGTSLQREVPARMPLT